MVVAFHQGCNKVSLLGTAIDTFIILGLVFTVQTEHGALEWLDHCKVTQIEYEMKSQPTVQGGL